MTTEWVKIEIDGQPLEARKGAMIIEVSDAAGIEIPRFCYHKHLSVAANCRMCLVEVEQGGRPAPKPLPACATPIMDGMKVMTKSPKAIAAQKATMEFLLINHPLDCPICDQGGECELQDVAMGYGGDVSRFSERKRAVRDKDIGPLVQTEMTRCIHCTRCVRFGEEVAGLRELGATGRGEHVEIGTYIEHAMASELSGNVIDLCPVGALTNKPARYTGRSWEYVQHQGVAPHDGVGSHLFIHTIRNQVKRVVPRDNSAINETWISDRDRFSYEAIYSPNRLTRPWLKSSGQVDWEVAIETVAKQLQQIVKQHGADQIGFLLSPSATLEELYLAQKIARGLGCHNVDTRLRQQDFSDTASDPNCPWLGMAINDLDQIDAALIIGSNPRLEQPLLNHRLRKAALKGAKIMAINHRHYDLNYDLNQEIACSPNELVAVVASVAKAVAEQQKVALPANLAVLATQKVGSTEQAMANALVQGIAKAVFIGQQAHMHSQFSALRALAVFIAKQTGATLGYLLDGANGVGAYLAGALPHRLPGAKSAKSAVLNLDALLKQPRKAYVLLGIDPELDCLQGDLAIMALQQAEFVVALTAFKNAEMASYAHALLPIATFAETAGTFVNLEGQWQSQQAACPPTELSRPAWKVLRVIGNALNLQGFEFLTAESVREELAQQCGDLQPNNLVESAARFTGMTVEKAEWQRIIEVPIYAVDSTTRQAKSLQATPLAIVSDKAVIHPETAKTLKLQPEDRLQIQLGAQTVATLDWLADDGVPQHCVAIATATTATYLLGATQTDFTISVAQQRQRA